MQIYREYILGKENSMSINLEAEMFLMNVKNKEINADGIK